MEPMFSANMRELFSNITILLLIKDNNKILIQFLMNLYLPLSYDRVSFIGKTLTFYWGIFCWGVEGKLPLCEDAGENYN